VKLDKNLNPVFNYTENTGAHEKAISDRLMKLTQKIASSISTKNLKRLYSVVRYYQNKYAYPLYALSKYATALESRLGINLFVPVFFPQFNTYTI
jgi:hypothetical protein